MKKKSTPSIQSFQVTEAGDDNWSDVNAMDAARAGEVWAEEHWSPKDGGRSYELDVKDASGKLYAVTVDVDYDVSFSGVATKHPCEP